MSRRYLLKIPVLLTTLAVLPLAGQGAYAAQCGAEAEEFQAAFLEELNNIRSSDTQCGDQTLPPVQPLVWNDTLAGAARAHSEDMATNNFFDYVGSDGVGYAQKAWLAGYQGKSVIGNIYAGNPDVAGIMNSLLESAPTCRALVKDDVQETGIACVEAPETSDYSNYWSLYFGGQGGGAPENNEKVSLVSALNNLCIDVPKSNFTDGVRLSMYQCNGTDAQKWALNDGLVVSSNGQCMDAAGGGLADGTPIQLATCSGSGAQQFTLTPEGDLTHGASGRCVDIVNFDESPGAPLILFPCQGTSNQKWSENG